MKQSASAFAPANISLIFKIHEHISPRWMGSYGLGFTIEKGITAEVFPSEQTKIYFNEKQIDFPSVSYVIQHLTSKPLTANLASPLPLGCGFGLSGASALAVSYAINELLHLQKMDKQLAILAHIADVVSKTGLGDVVNQFYGGVLVKFCPSASFMVEKVSVSTKKIYCRTYGELSTEDVLTDEKQKDHINTAADDALVKVRQVIKRLPVSFGEVLSLGHSFAENSGLLADPQVIDCIEKIEKQGGHATMIMLGKGVVSDIPFEGSTEYKITQKGAHLI